MKPLTQKEKINRVLDRLKQDIEVNKRCLKEDVSIDYKIMFDLWIKFDEELIRLLSEER